MSLSTRGGCKSRSGQGVCGLIIEQEKGSTFRIAATSLDAAKYSSQLASLQRGLTVHIYYHRAVVGSAGSAKHFPPPHSPSAPFGSPSSKHQEKIKHSARQCHLTLCAREGRRKRWAICAHRCMLKVDGDRVKANGSSPGRQNCCRRLRPLAPPSCEQGCRPASRTCCSLGSWQALQSVQAKHRPPGRMNGVISKSGGQFPNVENTLFEFDQVVVSENLEQCEQYECILGSCLCGSSC